MSLLADCDIVIEISKASLQDLLLSKVAINGTPLVPPFELFIPFPGGTAHLMVLDQNSVQLVHLTSDEKAVLNIAFRDSSIITTTLTAAPLVGNLVINIPLRITGSTEAQPNALIADMGSVQCLLNLDHNSQMTVKGALAQAPGSPPFAVFQTLANSTITTFLAALGPMVFDSLNIVPGQPGNLASPYSSGTPALSNIGLTGPAQVAIYPSFGVGDAAATQSGLNNPRAVAFDPSGNLWVADTANNRVLMFNHPFNSNGPNAAVVISQSIFTDPGISPSGLNAPGGLAFDTAGNLWVADTGNNRVLMFPAGPSSGMSASTVIGPSLTSGGGGMQVTQAGLQAPSGLTLDSSGNLWIADTGNNRVLMFQAPLATGMSPSLVIGQSGFMTSGTALSQTGLNAPSSLSLDSAGNLWVADAGNNRVLAFTLPPNGNGPNAMQVIGQSDFNVNPGPSAPTPSGLNVPGGLAFDTTTGKLWVADTGNNRVLVFSDPLNNKGPDATMVLGQTTLTAGGGATTRKGLESPAGLAFDSSGDLWVADADNNRVLMFKSPLNQSGPDAALVIGQAAETLWVADTGNNRVLMFPAGPYSGLSASMVIGQPSFTSGGPGVTQAGLQAPSGLTFDSSGNLWVADFGNHRILRFNAPLANGMSAALVIGPSLAPTPGASIYPAALAFDSSGNLWLADSNNNRVLKLKPPFGPGMPASLVIGQPGLTATGPATFQEPSGLAIDADDNLWVADTGNSRVLKFDKPLTSGMSASLVIGQSGFTTHGPALSQSGLSAPGALTLDEAGNLWVADTGNNRVLVFNSGNGPDAAQVIGQSVLTAGGLATTKSGLNAPLGLAFDSAGNLWVADAQNNRVLEFNLPLTANGPDAVNVIGQSIPQFERLLNHNIADEALGLFGFIIPGNDFIAFDPNNPAVNAAVIAQKTTTAIPMDAGVAISISPEIFHQSFFCPGLMSTYNLSTIDQLPGSCGMGGGIDTHQSGATLTSLRDTFDTGKINLDGSITQSGFCYSASATFHVDLTLPVVDGQLNPTTTKPQPNVSLTLEWYCVIASLVVGGILGGVIGIVIAAIIDVVITNFASSFLPSAPAPSIPGFGLPQLLPNLSITGDNIIPDGLTLIGVINVPLPTPATYIPSLNINGSVVNNSTNQLPMGTYHYQCMTPISCKDCPSKDFGYTEQGQTQEWTLTPVSAWLGTPITYQWWVGFDWNKIPLASPGGSLTIPVSSVFPFPLPSGTTVPVNAEITYTVSPAGDKITLIGRQADGNYLVGIYLQATDPAGVVLTQYTAVQFQGDVILFGSDYDDYMKACALARKIRTGMIRTKPQAVPPEAGWNQEDAVVLVENAAVLGSVSLGEVAAQASMRFGSAVLNAYATGRPLQFIVPGANNPALLTPGGIATS